MPVDIGTLLGPYEILAPLGAGGMGEVYRARDRRLGRDVAVKVLPDVFACRPDRLARFEREARAAGALSHPNILALYDVGTESGRPYVVLELLEGSTLRARLRRRDPLTVRKCLEIAVQAARGLDAAHAKGIVHRDLKPENLFLTADGVVKILDFGLAKLRGEPEPLPAGGVGAGGAVETSSGSGPTESLWQTTGGLLIGTAAYVSPEQARGEEADHRSDLFALGAVLYEMLTGEPAFDRETGPQTLAAVLAENPPDPSTQRPGIPPSIDALVRRCLEKDPCDRFQSARDIGFALETVAAGIDSHTNTGVSLPTLRARAGRRARWPRLPFAVGALVVLAGVLGWLANAKLARPAAVSPGTPHQVTSDPGLEAEPALSPDGSLVAYVSNRSGTNDIWIADVNGGGSVQLTEGLPNDMSPAWLPDGSALLFTSDRGARLPGIWKVPRLGGAAVPVATDARSPAVSPDGQWLAFVRGVDADSRVVVAPLSDPAKARPLTRPEQGLFGQDNPAWSPDGTQICYSDFVDLWVAKAAGGEPRQLTHAHAHDDSPAWAPDGREIVFSSLREGTLALWTVAAGGGEPTRLTLGTGPEAEPSWSRDGSRLAYSTIAAHSTADLAVADLRSHETRHIRGVLDENMPALSPDGRSVVFSGRRESVYDLWAQRLDVRAASPRRLTDSPGHKSRPIFSPDGRFIAFTRVLGDQRDLWIMPAGGGVARQLTDDPAQDMHAAFSPDGSRLAFVSDRAGPTNVWLMPLAAGAAAGPPTRVTSDAATDQHPWWSPDGRSIAFLREGEGATAVWVVPADGSAPPRTLVRAPGASAVRWTARGLYAAAQWDGEAFALRSLDPRTGALSRPLLAFGANGMFDISGDGRLVVYEDRPTRGDVWVLDRGPASRR